GIPVPLAGGFSPVTLAQQSSAFPVSGRIAIWDSINDTNPGGYGNFATAYDNFTPTTSAAINAITWTGGFAAPATAVPIDSFTITFYANSSNPPGAPLASFRIPFASANQVILGMQPGGGSPSLAANYSANLPNPFTVSANTQYWLSIVANYPF